MNTIIIVKVRERIINLSYSEAKQLLRKLDSAIGDTDEYKQEVKETQQYLDEFEKSNRQFPDELFKPKETPIASKLRPATSGRWWDAEGGI